MNSTLPPFSALPSINSATSNSFSATLLALTLIWMLIAGCCACGPSEAGAVGFSNDRSLVYCASTFNWGGGAASRGAPLPLVIKSLLERVRAGRGRMRLNSLRGERPCRRNGYHRAGSFHKDDLGKRMLSPARQAGRTKN